MRRCSTARASSTISDTTPASHEGKSKASYTELRNCGCGAGLRGRGAPGPAARSPPRRRSRRRVPRRGGRGRRIRPLWRGCRRCTNLDRLHPVGSDRGSTTVSTTAPASRIGTGSLLGAAVVASGVGLMFLHYYGGSLDDPEGFLSAVGFGSPTVGSGFLTIIGARRRVRSLLFATAVALIPISALSIVTLPLIAAAVAIAREGWRIEHRSTRSQSLASATASAGLVSAFIALVVHQDPVSWTTATYGGGSSSDIVTISEAMIALGFVGVSLALGIGVILRGRDEPSLRGKVGSGVDRHDPPYAVR